MFGKEGEGGDEIETQREEGVARVKEEKGMEEEGARERIRGGGRGGGG